MSDAEIARREAVELIRAAGNRDPIERVREHRARRAFYVERPTLLAPPPELAALLRYGRGMDTRRLVDQGFRYRYTSAGAVESFVEAKRLRRGTGHRPESYVYEREVEQFFQHSPTVIRSLEP